MLKQIKRITNNFKCKLILNIRKSKRLLQRFFNRFKDIWYIGLACFVIEIILIILSIKYNLYNELKSYISSIINITLTVYLIDFLRIEYDRIKNANKHYLLDVHIHTFGCQNILKLVRLLYEEDNFNNMFFLEDKLCNSSTEDIRKIIDARKFWDEIINVNCFLGYCYKISRKEYFVKIVNEMYEIISGFANTYVSISNYKQARFLINAHNLFSGIKFKYSRNEAFENSHSIGLDIYWIVETLNEAKTHLQYWDKDNDILSKIIKK